VGGGSKYNFIPSVKVVILYMEDSEGMISSSGTEMSLLYFQLSSQIPGYLPLVKNGWSLKLTSYYYRVLRLEKTYFYALHV
jgi:hypothetical protein